MNDNMKMKLSAPWVTYKKELDAMFGSDPDIRIVYDEEANEVKLYVNNVDKAIALEKILIPEKQFGSVMLKITVVPPNSDEYTVSDIFYTAFLGNPALSRAYSAETVLGNYNYVVFAKEVVQFFNDQLDDVNGNKSTLYQDIAKEIFKPELVAFYCTEADDKELQKPLGEWP